MKFSLLLIPFLTAFATWFVIWLLIKSLFYPLAPKHFGTLTWQGLVPAKQQELANQFGKFVKEHFFSPELLEQKLVSPDTVDKIIPEISVHVDEFLREKLPKSMPMISMFIGERTINQLKEVFMQELVILFPVILRKYINGLTREINIEALVAEKIMAIPPAAIAASFYKSLAGEIHKLQFAAAATGFLTGLVQLLIIWVA